MYELFCSFFVSTLVSFCILMFLFERGTLKKFFSKDNSIYGIFKKLENGVESDVNMNIITTESTSLNVPEITLEEYHFNFKEINSKMYDSLFLNVETSKHLLKIDVLKKLKSLGLDKYMVDYLHTEPREILISLTEYIEDEQPLSLRLCDNFTNLFQEGFVEMEVNHSLLPPDGVYVKLIIRG